MWAMEDVGSSMAWSHGICGEVQYHCTLENDGTTMEDV